MAESSNEKGTCKESGKECSSQSVSCTYKLVLHTRITEILNLKNAAISVDLIN
jgi:hypothetical protein